jgi:exodeoxyribonuclease-5
MFAAPTGKAAAVLRSKGLEAHTLHSLLYRLKGVTVDEEGKETLIFADKHWEQKTDLLVVDEASMVTTRLHTDLLERRVRVLYIGDHGQLPPVGGNPRLMEKADVRLEKIHRQAEGSGILRIAHAVRNRQRITSDYICDDVSIGRVTGTAHAVELAKRLGVDQTVVATNRERHEFNRLYRGSVADKYPQVGERVMCLANNRQENIWNGQTFTVEGCHQIAGDMGIYDIRSEDDGSLRENIAIFLPGLMDPEMEKRDLLENGANLFCFAYACTCHKMQGSQYDHLLVVDRPFAEAERWRYTAYTRAQSKLTIAR